MFNWKLWNTVISCMLVCSTGHRALVCSETSVYCFGQGYTEVKGTVQQFLDQSQIQHIQANIKKKSTFKAL